MKYNNIKIAKFINRKNRFISEIEIDNKIELCHVKNTGRCKELLIKGVDIFVQENNNINRKTKYSLICVKKGNILVNIDSQIPNYVAKEAIESGIVKEIKDITTIKQEVKYKNSRFDMYFETNKGKKGFIEIKGVTLEDNGIVKFPDAPSERAIKHINELIEAKKEGYEVYILFVIQLKNVKHFEPNKETHYKFYETLKYARDKGVHILAYDCFVSYDEIILKDNVDVIID
ncbi:DNA/RNA nuclease SfsA [uncultured Tyzzerella sp.]|uniref:DNA/RNA nuclease SfsA n=1 Tax=uncultured Tyzzerella sp. TaxID=2321398 RepID=UPI0029433D0C|nr:DNA/RNA nuclease SfsA [uncultured Tyzzerella sp.]